MLMEYLQTETPDATLLDKNPETWTMTETHLPCIQNADVSLVSLLSKDMVANMQLWMLNVLLQ